MCAKLVPKNLTNEQKGTCVRICTEWLENWDVFDCVITGDKNWIFAYDPEMQRQSREWKILEEPRTKKVRMFKSQTKVMIVTFFVCRSIILKHRYHTGKLLLLHITSRVLKMLWRAIMRKWPELWVNNSWPAPWQCTSTFRDRNSVVFGENIHHCVGTLCLFSRFSTEWLLFVPQDKRSL